MSIQTLLAFSAIALVTVMSPGPATLLAVRNAAAYGARSVLWSALGNVCGMFFLSSAAILGLGVLLTSSALLFGAVKILGACYLFYIGVRQMFGNAPALAADAQQTAAALTPRRGKLFAEAFLTAATNPKALLFFTALFPQFLHADSPLLPQFLILMAVFMVLSYLTHQGFAIIASRANGLLLRPALTRWVNRVLGATFISFGALLLTWRRQAA